MYNHVNEKAIKFIAVLSSFFITAAVFTIMIFANGNNENTVIGFTQNEIEITCGSSVSLNEFIEIPKETNKKIRFYSENTDCISVSEDATLSAKTNGAANIYAEYGKSVARIFVKSYIPAQMISMPEENILLEKGKSYWLLPALYPEQCTEKCIFESSDENIAQVSSNGVIKAISTGEAYITALTEKSGVSESVRVSVYVLPETIELLLNTDSLYVGDTLKAEYSLSPSDAKISSPVWSTSDASVIHIDSNGNIEAVDSGEAEIILTDPITGITASNKLKVSKPYIKLSARQTIYSGQTVDISVSVFPDSLKISNLSCFSSDTDIAEPSSNCSVNALSPGICTITVTAECGEFSLSSSIDIRVEEEIKVKYLSGIPIVNKTYSLPENYAPGVDAEAYNAFLLMSEAAEADGISLNIVSGYRSYAVQKYLYNNYAEANGYEVADTFSARPGHSEHQLGLAFDLNSCLNSFAYTPEAKWIAENCSRFGFILRYPEGKSSYTGYMYEPWHVRYVGKDLAQAITESGLSLEEYFGITSSYS